MNNKFFTKRNISIMVAVLGFFLICIIMAPSCFTHSELEQIRNGTYQK